MCDIRRNYGSVNSKRAYLPPGHLSGILQLCPPQGGAFAETGQPGGTRPGWGIVKNNFIFSILKDVHASLFILNFLSASNIKILKLS